MIVTDVPNDVVPNEIDFTLLDAAASAITVVEVAGREIVLSFHIENRRVDAVNCRKRAANLC